MAFKVLITEVANEDLAALVRFIARDNPQAAQRFGFALIDKLKLLQDHPNVGRIVPERANPNIREILHSPYRIVYRVRNNDSVVEILRFWHGARGKLELPK